MKKRKWGLNFPKGSISQKAIKGLYPWEPAFGNWNHGICNLWLFDRVIRKLFLRSYWTYWNETCWTLLICGFKTLYNTFLLYYFLQSTSFLVRPPICIEMGKFDHHNSQLLMQESTAVWPWTSPSRESSPITCSPSMCPAVCSSLSLGWTSISSQFLLLYHCYHLLPCATNTV